MSNGHREVAQLLFIVMKQTEGTHLTEPLLPNASQMLHEILQEHRTKS